MSKERAIRRAARQAEEQRQREIRERRSARQRRRRALLARLVPSRARRNTGTLVPGRSTGQRIAIGAVAAGLLLLVWTQIASLGTRIGLSALIVVTLPALVVLTFDRRA
jgi:hypothetical protein